MSTIGRGLRDAASSVTPIERVRAKRATTEDPAVPEHLEAEQAILSALLNGHDLPEGLTESQFSRAAHQRLYAVVGTLKAGASPVDPITVKDELLRRGELDAVGGIEYLTYLLDVVPTTANVAHYARIVAERATERQLLELSAAIRRDVSEQVRGPEMLTRVQARLVEVGATVTGPQPVRTVAELMADPEAMRAPQTVIPRLAWRGRVSQMAAAPKAGKSTLAAAGVAAMTQGRRFLDGPTTTGEVLWISADLEPVYDLAVRFEGFGADCTRILVPENPTMGMVQFYPLIIARRPVLVVVDTLLAAFADRVQDENSAGAWAPIMNEMRAVATASNAAILLLHHANKVTGKSRGSSQILAGVDAYLEIEEATDDPQARKVKAKGRWAMTPFRYRVDGCRVELDGGLPALDARVLDYVERVPGATGNAIAAAVEGRKADVLDAVQRLSRERLIVNLGGRNKAEWHRQGPAVPAVPVVPELAASAVVPGPYIRGPEPHAGTTHATGSGTTSEAA